MKLLVLMISLSLSSIGIASDFKITSPLMGQGTYNWFFLSVYDAKLWGLKSENLYSTPLVLELKYKRNFTGAEIVKQSEKELLKAGVDPSITSKWKEKLLEIFPDVKVGDTIIASFDPASGIIFYINSTKVLGQISDLEFSKMFLDIWLGKKTSDPKLRDKLLGKS